MLNAPSHSPTPEEIKLDLVNPYRAQLHDHPEYLLPEPDQKQLAIARGQAPTQAKALWVELGSGSGNFLLQMAQLSPETHFIGFELRYKRLVKCARKLTKKGLQNVWVLKEWGENFDKYFPPGSLDGVFLNFPDPWPKFAQRKKRLLNPPLLEQMEKTLKNGGRFCLKTDHSGYILHSLSLFYNRPNWKIRTFSNDHRKNGGLTALTEFEQLFLNQKKSIFYLEVEKTTTPD